MQTISRYLYGPTPEEKVRSWQGKLRSEQRVLERDMRQLDGAIKKARTQVTQLVNKGDTNNARILAKELVISRKQKDRLSVSKARLGSISNQLSQQLAVIKVTGTLQKSAEIMKLSNSLINLPQISQAMRKMSMEMTKAGILDEMIEDTLVLEENDDIEEEADAEVDKIIFEITDGTLGKAQSLDSELPLMQDQQEAERNLEQYQRQLNKLLSD